jgi:hypothetical protein
MVIWEKVVWAADNKKYKDTWNIHKLAHIERYYEIDRHRHYILTYYKVHKCIQLVHRDILKLSPEIEKIDFKMKVQEMS